LAAVVQTPKPFGPSTPVLLKPLRVPESREGVDAGVGRRRPPGAGGQQVGVVGRRRQRRPRRGAGAAPQAMASPVAAVQRLFEACREVFNDAGPGAVPPPAGIERVKAVLGN